MDSVHVTTSLRLAKLALGNWCCTYSPDDSIVTSSGCKVKRRKRNKHAYAPVESSQKVLSKSVACDPTPGDLIYK